MHGPKARGLPMTRLPILLACAGLLCAQEPAPSPTPAPTQFVVPGVRKVTFSGQYRARYENQVDFDLDDDVRPDTNDFVTQRVRLAAALDFSDRLAAFVQIQDVREWGEETSTIDDAADGLDVHQGWAELRDTPLFAGTTRIGRQEFFLGDHRLVGVLDWKSQARTFDGVAQTWTSEGGSTLQAWAMQVRETLSPATVNDDQWFVGTQVSGRCCADVLTDLYSMLLHDDGVSPGTSANRITLGTRWLAKSAAWEFGLEAATQFGEQAGFDIPIGKTWAGHLHLTHRGDAKPEPWLKVELNAASGDDPSTADRERFDNLFPTAHAHWGMMDLALWENMINPMLQVGFHTCSASDLSLSWNFFRSMEARDRFGGPNGTLVPANATDSRTIGNEIDVVYARQVDLGTTAKTAVQLGYAAFLPGSAPESIGRDTIAHFVYAQFDVRF